MSVTENKALVQRLVDEGWNGKSLDVFDEVLAPNFVNHDPNTPSVTDRDGLKQFAQAVWSAFPDFEVQITDAIGEEDRGAKCWVGRGTQTGEFMGIPASGKRVEFEGVTVYRMAEGKVVSLSWSSDMLTLLQQLSVIAAMGATPA